MIPESRAMLYQSYQAHSDLWWPLRTSASAAVPVLSHLESRLGPIKTVREAAAACEVIDLVQLTHKRPSFEIAAVTIGGREIPVVEQTVLRTPFATLLRFAKPELTSPQPKVLIVAPMSGHFATLLRETIRTMLGDHDVYVTDWHNGRDVPLASGRFGLDEYIEHIMQFVRHMGEDTHVVAICQPCVAALAATALMAQAGEIVQPASLTLMAGPIDCRINPTGVNKLATSKPIEWFETRLISTVPLRFAGALRRVYPGFLQLMAFMNMNLDRHTQSLRGLYADLVNGEHERADTTRRFYKEYFAVSDLPAEFYLETVRDVFQEYALPQGRLQFRGQPIELGAIRRTALLTVEGERDDICSLGQTLAAQDLCTGVRAYMKTHYMQAGAGHYGVFSGRRWNNYIYPIVRDVIQNARYV